MSRINVLLFEFLSLTNPSNYVPCKRDTPSTTYPLSNERRYNLPSLCVERDPFFALPVPLFETIAIEGGILWLLDPSIRDSLDRKRGIDAMIDARRTTPKRREGRIRFSASGGRNRMERRESEIDNWIAAGRASKHASQGSVPSNVSAGSRDPYLIRAASALEPPLISSDTGRSPFFPSNPPSLGQVKAKNYPELPARIVFSIRRNFDKFRGQIPLIVE